MDLYAKPMFPLHYPPRIFCRNTKEAFEHRLQHQTQIHKAFFILLWIDTLGSDIIITPKILLRLRLALHVLLVPGALLNPGLLSCLRMEPGSRDLALLHFMDFAKVLQQCAPGLDLVLIAHIALRLAEAIALLVWRHRDLVALIRLGVARWLRRTARLTGG